VIDFVAEGAGLINLRRGFRRIPKIFAENCAVCHGDAGKGNQELGAPNLADKIWLYGSDEATLIETITIGRSGVMPAWVGRLDPSTVKALAVYVHSLGGGSDGEEQARDLWSLARLLRWINCASEVGSTLDCRCQMIAADEQALSPDCSGF